MYFFPIRIEDCIGDIRIENETCLISAIVSYNYALSIWCFAVSNDSRSAFPQQFIPTSTSDQQSVIFLLERSYDLLCHITQPNLDDYYLRTVASVKCTVVASLLRFLSSCKPWQCSWTDTEMQIVRSRLLWKLVELESLTFAMDKIFHFWRGAYHLAAAA